MLTNFQNLFSNELYIGLMLFTIGTLNALLHYLAKYNMLKSNIV